MKLCSHCKLDTGHFNLKLKNMKGPRHKRESRGWKERKENKTKKSNKKKKPKGGKDMMTVQRKYNTKIILCA